MTGDMNQVVEGLRSKLGALDYYQKKKEKEDGRSWVP
jgi:hypothetical protein